jgi:hypothetical protein
LGILFSILSTFGALFTITVDITLKKRSLHSTLVFHLAVAGINS